MVSKIISGGQTGADQGALDGAISCGFPYGGTIPAGRKTETGILPRSYKMHELNSSHYADRTEQNVRDGDATLILSNGPLTGGSALTEKIAQRLDKPYLHVDFSNSDPDRATAVVSAWVERFSIQTLNVAGPRGSSDPRIYNLTRDLIISLIEGQNH